MQLKYNKNNKQSRNILVTGAAGFVGFHVAKALLDQGHTVIGVDDFNDYYSPSLKEARTKMLQAFPSYILYREDITDFDTMEKIFNAVHIDKICHFAAYAGITYSFENPILFEQVNNLGTLILLELARYRDIPAFIYASSASVYGNLKKMPWAEDQCSTDAPTSLYGATKKSNELFASLYTYNFHMPTTGLRFFTVYGPWGRPDMALYSFTDAICHDKPITIYNGGNVTRDFVYIDDVVQAVLLALEANLSHEVINIAADKQESVVDCVRIIERCLHKKAIIQDKPLPRGDVPHTNADISKARNLLGYKPTVRVQEGIPKFVEWYKQFHKIS